MKFLWIFLTIIVLLGGVIVKRMSVYPFTAIVGQDDMKMSLILNVINPSLGGVLIKGEKGTAKSTVVRALAELLPAMEAVHGCKFHCDPADPNLLCEDCASKYTEDNKLVADTVKMRVVELPVSATENRNILYVDEINLLDDHVVDVLLDAAAMGINTVEREGVSYSHPARFVLVGTMNPEEGDIRPQLLDRFGLSVVVTGEHDPAQRVEVIKRRLVYEQDANTFIAGYQHDQEELAAKITQASSLLPQVDINEELLETVAKLAVELGVDGHRADITVIKTALTLAAFNGRKEVELEDVKNAAKLVLPHRMRRRPFEEGQLDWDKVESILSSGAKGAL